MDNFHPDQLPSILLNTGEDLTFKPDQVVPQNYNFYQWKDYEEDTYWRANFPTEFEIQATAVKRHLPLYNID